MTRLQTGDRSRAVYQKRLGLLELDVIESQPKGDPCGICEAARLHHLLPDVLKHHHHVHDVLILIYLAIVFFVLDMLLGNSFTACARVSSQLDNSLTESIDHGMGAIALRETLMRY